MSDDILTSYSGVTLSQDEVNSLVGDNESSVEQKNEGESQPPESEVPQDQSLAESEQEKTEELEVLELDGAEYDYDTVKEALEAYNNKADWQKSNTEKSQALSAERKSLEAEQKLWMGLRNNEDAMAALQDVLDEDHPLFSNDPVVAEEEQPQDTKDIDRIQELERRLNEITEIAENERLDMEADKQVNQDLAVLKQNHPELQDEKFLDEVITTAIEKGFTGLEGLEDAYALTLHSASEDSAFKTAVNRARNAKAMKSVPEPESPARGVHEEPNAKHSSYRAAKADALKNYNFYE